MQYACIRGILRATIGSRGDVSHRIHSLYRVPRSGFGVGLSPFIVDFYAAGAKLVVEIDGAVHESRGERDAARVEQLVALHRVRVVRIAAADVMLNVVAVVAALRAVI